uniref:Reverse transcriptase domain-containing protein n=1 Tax=Amphimedon queenslandica TaxID=400682 RepID=A0A1X7UQS0_AMPQE
MEEMRVIKQSCSEWAAPIVVVPKKDGTIRQCVDYRKLNKVSKFDAYPVPRVDEMIDCVGNGRYITTLDLNKGYWQIPMEETARDKTAFITPFGVYEFTMMPFGLQGAPATFQRLMD